MDNNKMAYLITTPHEVLCFLVGPFLSWPLLREVYELLRWLLLALFAVWCPVPNNGGCGVTVETQRLGAVIGSRKKIQSCIVTKCPCLGISEVGGG